MKIAALDTPVRASWLAKKGFRLDAKPYVSRAYDARTLIQEYPRTETLGEVTSRIFHAGRVTRSWTTSPDFGVPFLGSADIFQADLTSLQLLTRSAMKKNPKLPIEPGWTLITRSGMTAGRVAYARLSMQGLACSEDVLRVVADGDKIPPGYLYTFLASPLGIPMVKGDVYGTSVRHIEPEHVAEIPIPRIGKAKEHRIDELIQESMESRQRFEDGVCAATRDLFESAGIPDLLDVRWHDQPRDIDFSVSGLTPMTIRALNFTPRTRRILSRLSGIPHRTLGDICRGGRLARGNRFKRVESDSENGVQLVGQRQGFWLRPEGRRILMSEAEQRAVKAANETVLIASQGTLGEGEVFCRPVFATGSWIDNYVFSEHFLRVVSGDPEFSGAYLFAFLRSEAAFRILRSLATGGKQQDIHEMLRAEIPVPECTQSDRERIAETVRAAYRDRDEADKKEDQAFKLLDDAVREAAR
ncbi:hypothetical protein OHA21_38080 [Actinoplanes sp. NBC_00393]|uniref:methylation-associated defense system restriction endonuclease subunit S MAD5 n=1 Tax=Actinoplanes sp. NBC_00393 TaxID=2975953 RepID=UPI002E1A6B55